VIRRDAVDHPLGIAAFQPKLGERGLIEETDAGSHGAVFTSAMLEPILAAIAVVVAGLDTAWGVPIGAFPAERLAETCAGGGQTVMQRRFASASRRCVLTERPVSGV